MRTERQQSAMTLVEILVVLAVILIMIGALGGAGIHLKKQSEIRLTEGALGVLVMAIEQYYTDANPNIFPFQTYDLDLPLDGIAHEYTEASLEADIMTYLSATAVTVVNPPAEHSDPYASSEALYYFLSRSPNAAAIMSTLMDRVISNKAANGAVLQVEITVAGVTTTYDLIRFVDAWGMPIRYEYDPAIDQFPILTSAGPDKRFDTASDNITNQ
jgi:type II secretory pathway pseudopilin PulG